MDTRQGGYAWLRPLTTNRVMFFFLPTGIKMKFLGILHCNLIEICGNTLPMRRHSRNDVVTWSTFAARSCTNNESMEIFACQTNMNTLNGIMASNNIIDKMS